MEKISPPRPAPPGYRDCFCKLGKDYFDLMFVRKNSYSSPRTLLQGQSTERGKAMGSHVEVLNKCSGAMP
jgi:hypothetical protein